LFQHNYKNISQKITGYTVSDTITEQTILNTYLNEQYLLDPHGAVAYYALSEYLKQYPSKAGIFLETAHPVKFPETLEALTHKKIEIPVAVQHLFAKEKKSILMEANFKALKEWLLAR
jgi:threonine synthase